MDTHMPPAKGAPAALLTLCGITHVQAFLAGSHPTISKKKATCEKCKLSVPEA